MADLVDGRVRYAALPPDQPVETGRYVDALRRSKLLIAFIVVSLTGAVLLVSMALPKTYRATAKILVESTTDPSTGDAASMERSLATTNAILTTRKTLRQARRRLPGETVATLQDKVRATVDPTANIINVVATDDTAKGAARTANAVAATFLTEQRRVERRRMADALATLQAAHAMLGEG